MQGLDWLDIERTALVFRRYSELVPFSHENNGINMTYEAICSIAATRLASTGFPHMEEAKELSRKFNLYRDVNSKSEAEAVDSQGDADVSVTEWFRMTALYIEYPQLMALVEAIDWSHSHSHSHNRSHASSTSIISLDWIQSLDRRTCEFLLNCWMTALVAKDLSIIVATAPLPYHPVVSDTSMPLPDVNDTILTRHVKVLRTQTADTAGLVDVSNNHWQDMHLDGNGHPDLANRPYRSIMGKCKWCGLIDIGRKTCMDQVSPSHYCLFFLF